MTGRRRRPSVPKLLSVFEDSPGRECGEVIGSSTAELTDVRLTAEMRCSDLLGIGGECGIDTARRGDLMFGCGIDVLMEMIDGRV